MEKQYKGYFIIRTSRKGINYYTIYSNGTYIQKAHGEKILFKTMKEVKEYIDKH